MLILEIYGKASTSDTADYHVSNMDINPFCYHNHCTTEAYKSVSPI